MIQIKRLLKVSALVLILSMVAPVALPISNTIVAEAATVKISYSKLTLEVGKTKTLKISGTTKKATWKSSDKSVATVSTSGKVTAKKAGSATITATVNKKNYICKVTVTAATPKASFETQEVTDGNFKFSIPKTWKQHPMDIGGKTYSYYMQQEDVQIFTDSNILIAVKDNIKKESFDTLDEFKAVYTEQLYKATFAASSIGVSNLQISEYKTDLGPAYRVQVTLKYGDFSYTQVQYKVYTNNVEFGVTLTNYGEIKTIDVNEMAEYIVKTLKPVK